MSNDTEKLLRLAKSIGYKDAHIRSSDSKGRLLKECCREINYVDSINRIWRFDPRDDDGSFFDLLEWLLTLGSFDLITTDHNPDKHCSTVVFNLINTGIGEGCFYSDNGDLKTEMLNVALQVSEYIDGGESK